MASRLSRICASDTRLMEALAERAPVVFFLDDVQWVDSASLDLLPYLGRRWSESSSPVLLLLTLRSETLAEQYHPSTTTSLNQWLSGLARPFCSERQALPP